MSTKNEWSRPVINSVSYLSYYFVGALISTLGIVIGPLCKAFGKDLSFIGQIFTIMNFGMFVPILFGGLLMKKMGLKMPLVIASTLTIMACTILFLHPSLEVFIFTITILGASGGVYMTIGSYLVVRINPDAKKRSSSLIFTDFFFSFAGATLAVLLAQLFNLGANWMAMYGIMGGLGTLMLLLTWRSKFPTVEEEATEVINDKATVVKEPWHIAIYLICIAQFTNVFSELTFSLWMPTYVADAFSLAPENAAFYTGCYWWAKATGLFVHQYTVKMMQLRTFLITCALIGLSSIFTIVLSDNATLVLVATGLLGFFNAGLFSGFMSYGTLQVKKASPNLISLILTCGTVGTLSFSAVSSAVNSWLGLHWAIGSSAIAYSVLIVALISAVILSRAEKIHKPEEMTAH